MNQNNKHDNPTNDLTQFGYRELAEAGKLLIAYAENGSDFLTDGVQVWFNKNSGTVFLSDEDYNVGVLVEKENGVLKEYDIEQFFSCPICGHEGILSEMQHGEENTECKQFLKNIGIIEIEDDAP